MTSHRDGTESWLFVLAVAVVGVGYYALARLSLGLAFQPDYIAALWLPNGVLLAALLVQPVRRWPVFLLVCTAAEFAADVPGGISWTAAAGFVVADWVEVLLAAGLCRRWVRLPEIFGELRPFLAFLVCAALVAPLVSAFPGAWMTGLGEAAAGYWTRWQRWATGDLLTHLIFTPFLLVWLATESRDLRQRASLARLLELGAVMALLIVTATVALGARTESLATLPALVYLPLPALLWLALRFGPRGLLTAGAFVTLLAVWNASQGLGPFTGLSVEQNVLNLQLFVVISLTPLSILAVAIENRRATERELIRSEEKYRYFYQNLYDLHYLTDAAGVVLSVSPSVHRIAGYAPEEMIGRPLADFYVEPRDRDRFLAEIVRAGFVENYEAALRAADGSIVWVSTNARLLRDDRGEVRGVEGVTRDITELKRAQREREELQEELQRAQKMEAIGTLAGGIAHDFNNLLMGIQGRAELIREDVGPAHPAEEHVGSIEHHVRSAAGLTRQLLGFARGGKYQARPTDLNALIERTADMFGRTRKEIVVCLDLEPELWAVSVDRGQVEQVLLNILVNAWHAMPDGGELTIASRNREYGEQDDRPFGLRAGRYVAVAITDTGTGMDADVRARVFDPFFTTKAKERGTGLGLASAYGIVKNHGGVIDVTSEKGVGSTFTLWLPAVDAVAEGRPGRRRRESVPGSGTVLLVDDEEQILAVGELMLRRLGYEPLTAASGGEALDLYAARAPEIDVVLLDMIMPGLAGGEVFDRLRGLDPDVTVVLSSGYSLDETAAAILERGCAGFIQKPFTMEELSRLLDEVRQR